MLSLKWELSTCSKWWTSLTSPNLDVGPWTLNCWMSSSTELVPCHRVESFCHAVASQFGSANMRSTSASNSSIVIGIPEGLRTCWILCITHVLAALPFMYDRMNRIQLVLSGNSDPHRCTYVQAALHLEVIEVILQTCEWSGCGNLQKFGCGRWWR